MAPARVTTGNPRVDAILDGGLTPHSIVLLAGAPGTGKTLLAEQTAFANARDGTRTLYLSTVSEPLDKLLRYGQSLTFFDTARVGTNVIFDDLGACLDEGGPDALLVRIVELVTEHQPSLVVIDSFKAIGAYTTTEERYRRFLHALAGHLTVRALTCVWVGEYEPAALGTSAEFAVADTVVALASTTTDERVTRYLSVLKHRGSDYASGSHAYRLGPDGLTLYPRLADRSTDPVGTDPVGEEQAPLRLSTGIPALDDALGEGYWPGSTTLVLGPSGSGKTIMGLHFLHAGAASGERGLLVSLQETRAQLTRATSSFGWDPDDPAVGVLNVSPVDVLIDELAHRILDRVVARHARRVVIDSLNDLRLSGAEPVRFREFVVTLIRRLQHLGVSTLFTLQSPGLFRVNSLDSEGLSHLADNVVVLQYIPQGQEMKRTLTVLKTRGSAHAPQIRELRITAQGLTLGDPITLTSQTAYPFDHTPPAFRPLPADPGGAVRRS